MNIYKGDEESDRRWTLVDLANLRASNAIVVHGGVGKRSLQVPLFWSKLVIRAILCRYHHKVPENPRY